VNDILNNTPEEKGHVVLVVDDQLIVVEAVRRMLQSQTDIEFHYCTDPTKAIDKAIEVSPSVILLDLVMPEIDGMTLLSFFRANSKTEDIPIIVVSAIETPVDKGAAFSAGATDYIVKLPDKIELVARIRSHSQNYLNKLQRDEAFIELKSLKAELEESNEALQLLSCLDGLTGVANRRRFDEFLAKEWKRAMREKTSIALILIDIDYFKAFNDNYGHQQGDETLKSVVNALNSGINRPADLLARYGGEEFVVVLPETNMMGAMILANSLRQRVSSLEIPHEYSDTSDYVTVSLGVSCCEGGQVFKSSTKLITDADKALYEAKDAGRNIVRGSCECKNGRCKALNDTILKSV